MATADSLYVDAGATFTRQYEYLNDDNSVFDLTGFTAKAQVRSLSDTKMFEVTPTIDVPTGMISMTWSATQTALLVDPLYQWGLELTNAGTGVVIRLVEGSVTVSAELVK